MLKLWVFELLAAENILYFDADLVFLRKWNPLIFAGVAEFVCVRDHWYRTNIQADARLFGVPADEYFNSGFFIANRTHHGQMMQFARQCLYEAPTLLPDQGPMNAARSRLKIPLHFLSRRFNTVGAPASPLWKEVEAVAVHGAGRHHRAIPAIVRETEALGEPPTASMEDGAGEMWTRDFWCRIGDADPCRLRFSRDGTVWGSTDPRIRLWFVVEGKAGPELLLTHEFKVSYRLFQKPGGWKGRDEESIEKGDCIELEPTQGQLLIQACRRVKLSPEHGAIVGPIDGNSANSLIERFSGLRINIAICAADRIRAEDFRDILADATGHIMERRFILNAKCLEIARVAIDGPPLDFLVFGPEAIAKDNDLLAWCSMVREGGIIAVEAADKSQREESCIIGVLKRYQFELTRDGDLHWLHVTPSVRERLALIRKNQHRFEPPKTITETTAYGVAMSFLESVEPYPADQFHGKGIVMCGGGKRYFTCAWVCINMLRRSGCKLPIELWSIDSHEIDANLRRLIEPLGVTCVNAQSFRRRYPARILNGWELKSYAVIHSSFEEVLYIDTDNVIVSDPTKLFDASAYREHGAVFWPDFERLAPDRPIWNICRVTYRDEPEFETGQMVIDKRRCWKSLQLTMHLNEYSDFYYKYVYGDKETFHMAWHMSAQSFAMIPYPLEALSHVMCQHDFDGKRLFQHRNMAKWELDGNNLNIEGFQFEDICLRHVEELRQQWDGTVGYDRLPFSMAEVNEAKQIVLQRKYQYMRVGYDRRNVELLEGGRVGAGQAACEKYWYLTTHPNRGVLLSFFGRNKVTCRLRPGENGIWKGRWQMAEGMPVELIPIA